MSIIKNIFYLSKSFKQKRQYNSSVLDLKVNSHNSTSNDRMKKTETVLDSQLYSRQMKWQNETMIFAYN